MHRGVSRFDRPRVKQDKNRGALLAQMLFYAQQNALVEGAPASPFEKGNVPFLIGKAYAFRTRCIPLRTQDT